MNWIQFQINMKNKTAKLGILLALAFILSYIESLIPINMAIPGIKLGLANIVIVYCLFTMKTGETILITLTRNLLVAMTFGNFSLFFYSTGGSMLSIITMLTMKKLTYSARRILSISGISMLGGISHNIGQLLVAILFISNLNLMYYMPILIIVGAMTGFIIGLIVNKIYIKMIGDQHDYNT